MNSRWITELVNKIRGSRSRVGIEIAVEKEGKRKEGGKEWRLIGCSVQLETRERAGVVF
jgi:hypothetical protein